MVDGRVVAVTGGGRGLGYEYALLLAREGAKVLVNDIGVRRDGEPESVDAAQAVVDEIVGRGGYALAHTDDVSTMDGAKSLIDHAIDAWGRIDVVVNNAGILRDRMVVNMTEDDWDSVMRVHLKSTFATTHHAANVCESHGQGGRAGRCPHHQHHLGIGHLRRRRPGQLRGRQGRHRGVHDHHRPRARSGTA